MIALARASRQPGISTRYGNQLTPQFAEYVDYEAFASVIKNYETKLVPGLLQTRGYASPIVEAYVPEDGQSRNKVVLARVDARNERAKYITGLDGPAARFIIDEGALHRAVGGESSLWERKYDTMIRVLDHLKSLNTEGMRRRGQPLDRSVNPDLSIQIVPFEIGAYAALGAPFVILEFDSTEDGPLLYFEHPTGDELLRAPDVTKKYTELFEELSNRIPGPEETDAILDHIRDSFPSRLKKYPAKIRPPPARPEEIDAIPPTALSEAG